jgi:tetratricopeptide (TPR) repeat protein
MKTCPLLWRQDDKHEDPSPQAGKDSADETFTGTADRSDPLPECLGPACRFCQEDGVCSLEEQQRILVNIEQRLAESEERFESFMLSLVELTERMESALLPTPAATAPPPASESPPEESPAVDRVTAHKANREGIEHYQANRLEEARVCFQDALDKDPAFVEARNNLGLIETELGHLAAATQHFGKAIVLAPELATGYANLGYAFYRQGSHIEAVSMFEEALQRGENTSALWTNLGNAQFELGNIEKARQAWGKAVALDPCNVKAAKNLVRIAQDVTV